MQLPQKEIDNIQGMIDYDDSIISKGCMIMGRCCSLDDDHISRIKSATQYHIDRIKAKYGLIPPVPYRRGM